MSVQQAVQGQRECAKEMEAIHSRAPHFREEYLVYFLSEITLCDGATVDPQVLQHSKGKSDWHYLREKPPRKHLHTTVGESDQTGGPKRQCKQT